MQQIKLFQHRLKSHFLVGLINNTHHLPSLLVSIGFHFHLKLYCLIKNLSMQLYYLYYAVIFGISLLDSLLNWLFFNFNTTSLNE